MAVTILTDSSNLLNRPISRARSSFAVPAARLDFVQALLAAMRRIPGVYDERDAQQNEDMGTYNRFMGPAPRTEIVSLCFCVRWLPGAILMGKQQPYRKTGVNIYALSTYFIYSEKTQ